MEAKLAVLSGDGIGPEIMLEGIKVLQAIERKFYHKFSCRNGLIGGAAIDHSGSPYPQETHQLCSDSDAILFGAIGAPKYDNDPNARIRPEQGLLAMRSALGLFANLRPVKSFPSLFSKSPLKEDRLIGVDFIVLRELTGGIYFGKPSEISADQQNAVDTCLYSVDEITRIARMAFDLAGRRNRKLTLVDKANVLSTSRLWRKVVQKMAKVYPDIQLEYLYVDNAAMQLILRPAQFDVILTENMFGDILTDEASVLPGSIGLLPSASVGEKAALFEPIHGSFPEATGKGIANPFGMIRSVAMMLEVKFKLVEEAAMIDEAINQALNSGIGTLDLFPENPVSTSEAGSWISNFILGQ